MKKKKLIGLVLAGSMAVSMILPGMSAFADQFNVISIGANLTQSQQNEMMNYFNAKQGSYEKIMINNAEEQSQLRGVLPESEIGTRTISCAYVQPTTSGGINVKTTNLTYVTANMIANALTTAGIYNANVVAAAPFQVSGTGALTGVIIGYQKATGEQIPVAKQKLANKELATTANIASDPNVGQDKATAVVSNVKAQVIQNGEHDSSQIASTINNVTNNYGVKLTPAQEQDLNNLMQGISKQDYNKQAIENTLDKINDNMNKLLQEQGQLKGMMANLDVHFDNFVSWVKNIFTSAKDEAEKAGITNDTNDNSTVAKDGVSTGSSSIIKDAVTTATGLTKQVKDAANSESAKLGNEFKDSNTTNTHIDTTNTQSNNTQNQ